MDTTHKENPRARAPRWRALVLALALLLSPSTASAEEFDGPKAAAARTLFDEAMQLADAGEHAKACPKFEESNRLDPGMGVKYRLALCYEKTLRLASAWALFTQLADEAARSKMTEREAVARGKADALRLRVPRVIVLVPREVAETRGLEVHFDGEVMAPATFGVALPADVGQHRVSVVAPGKRQWETTAQASESATITVTIPTLQEEPVIGPVVPAATSSPTDRAAGWSGRHTAGIAVAGAGLLGLGLGIGFGIDTITKHNASTAACPARTNCGAAAVDLENAAKASATGSTVGFILGGAALVGGAVLFFTAPWPGQEGPSKEAVLRLRGGPQSASVLIEGGF